MGAPPQTWGAHYHTVAQERRCASQQKLRADVADGSMLLKKDFVGGLRATLIQDQGQTRNQDSKIYLPGFHRFKFEFHSFFAETFSTISTHNGLPPVSTPALHKS